MPSTAYWRSEFDSFMGRYIFNFILVKLSTLAEHKAHLTYGKLSFKTKWKNAIFKIGPSRKIFCNWIYPFHAISSNFSWQKAPPPPLMKKIWDWNGSIHFMQFPATLVQLTEKPPPQEKKFWDWIYPFHAISSNFGSVGRKGPPFLPFCERPGSCCTWRIPMVPILQIHTWIPPIRISSIGYQLCQLFKILTYTEVLDTGSWCMWKAYRQPYHNTH